MPARPWTAPWINGIYAPPRPYKRQEASTRPKPLSPDHNARPMRREGPSFEVFIPARVWQHTCPYTWQPHVHTPLYTQATAAKAIDAEAALRSPKQQVHKVIYARMHMRMHASMHTSMHLYVHIYVRTAALADATPQFPNGQTIHRMFRRMRRRLLRRTPSNVPSNVPSNAIERSISVAEFLR